jgi:ABC-2 type transport system ATP-binding protein
LGYSVEFRDISKSIKGKDIIKDCSFNIEQGEMCALIGPSGSGKSTILKIIAGLYRPDSGIVLINKEDAKARKHIREIGFAFQDTSLYEELSVIENLYYFARLYRIEKHIIRQRAQNLLALVSLSEYSNIPFGSLSGGMKRRVEIACSLLHEPKILILDEPMTGLDPKLRKEIWGIIRKIENTTVIMSTHLVDEIEGCDRFIVVNSGKISFSGNIEQVKNDFPIYEEIHLETYPGNYSSFSSMLASDEIISYASNDNRLTIKTKNKKETIRKINLLLKEHGETMIDLDITKSSFNILGEHR